MLSHVIQRPPHRTSLRLLSVLLVLHVFLINNSSQYTQYEYGRGMPSCSWEPKCFCQDESVYTNGEYHLLVDCSNAGLTEIPIGIPRNTTVLALRGNNIREIPANSFENLTELKFLDLSNSSIERLNVQSFNGLWNLEGLELDRNGIRYDNTSIPNEVFKPLSNLTRLNIQQTFPDVAHSEDYPIKAISYLVNLQHLLIDGLAGRNFAGSFAELKNTQYLFTLILNGENGRCSIERITPGMFKFSTNLISLIVRKCDISVIEKGSFQELPILKKLDLSNNIKLEFKSLPNITYGLQNRKLYEFSLIGIHETKGECTRIEKKHLAYTRKISVKHFYLDSNRLSWFDKDSICYLPTNITVLSLRDNMLLPGDYVSLLYLSLRDLIYVDASAQTLYRDIGALTRFKRGEADAEVHTRKTAETVNKLNTISSVLKDQDLTSDVNDTTSDVNDTNGEHDKTTLVKLGDIEHFRNQLDNSGNSTNSYQIKDESPLHQNSESKLAEYLTENETLCEDIGNLEAENTGPSAFLRILPNEVTFRLWNNLTDLDLSSMNIRLKLVSVNLDPDNSLTRLDLHNNVFWSWEGPLKGFHMLMNLNLAWNSCENLTTTFFHPLTELLTLNLSRNFLDPFISRDTDGKIFQNQTKLKRLDLSENKLSYLPPKLFNGLWSLEDLYLMGNFLIKFEVELNTSRLFYIDLHSNALGFIKPSTAERLSKIATENGDLKIDLSNNDLQCTCKEIALVRWIAHKSEVTFINLHDYMCKFENGSTVQLSNAEILLSQLDHKCANYFAVLLASSISVTMTLVALFMCLAYRYRWDLRYFYYSAKMKFHGYTPVPSGEDNDGFMYDVFISYSNDSGRLVKDRFVPELEDKRNFTVLVHDRDFAAGNYVCDNIMRAIATSRKTIILLNNEFMKSEWCKFEMNMARMEAVKTGREVICVVMLEHVRTEGLPMEIIDIIRNRTYFEFPENYENIDDVMWERLARALESY